MTERKTDQQPLQENQRRALRAPLLVRKIRLEENRKVFFGYSKNLSRSGMFIATVNPLEPGSRVKVELPLPPPLSGSVSCECEVIWKRSYSRNASYEPGMGMRFLDLSDAAGEIIDGWVKDADPGK